MFDVAQSLEPALNKAQEELRAAQAAVASANAGRNARSTSMAMAQTARAALFDQALLNVVHARLSELKAVART